jgi:selenocysteine lyase/cysteine desulfurase
VCGGEESILEYIQEIARKGGDKVAEILGTEVMNNEEGTTRKCAFANVRLPVDMSLVEDGDGIQGRSVFRDYFEERLMQEDYDTFLAICWHGGAWWVRLSGQIYLDLEDFEWVGEALKKVCGEEWKAIRASKKE